MRGQSPLSAVDRRKADWVNDYDDLSNSKPSAVPPNISYPAFDNPATAENNILFHRQLRDKVKSLKDKADIPASKYRQFSVIHGKMSLPSINTLPEVGTSKAPTIFSSVLCPNQILRRLPHILP